MEHWRETLYPLGFLASFFFGVRTLEQWALSEWHKKSVVTSLFWFISLLGNIALFAQGVIQMQFPVSLVQSINTVISFRNLNLMQPKEKQITYKSVVLIMGVSVCVCIGIFITQSIMTGDTDWFRVPVTPWDSQANDPIFWFWHVIGALGLALFGLRFWVQWWTSEHYGKSVLSKTFWWISLVGNFFCVAYFFRIQDPVNLIGPMIGTIPYIRNLILIYREEKAL